MITISFPFECPLSPMNQSYLVGAANFRFPPEVSIDANGLKAATGL
jgi:hypothetical protein